jgi:hypothetical protein
MRNWVLFHGRVLLVLLVAISTMPDVLGAQEAVSIPAGTRIRISAPALKEQLPPLSLKNRIWGDPYSEADPRKGRATATVLSSDPDSLVFQLEKGDIRTALPWNSIEMLETDSGRGENAAMVGALIGMAAGGALGYSAGEDECRRTDYQCMSRRSGGVVFGLVGLVLGAGIGALIVDEWDPVALPTRVSLRRGAGGNFQVSASRRL